MYLDSLCPFFTAVLLFAALSRDLGVVSSDLRPAGRQWLHSSPASVLYKGVSRCCALFLYAQHMKCIHVPAAPAPCSLACESQGPRSASAVFPFCTSKYLQSFYDLNLYFSELRCLCLKSRLTLFNTWRTSRCRGTMLYHTVARVLFLFWFFLLFFLLLQYSYCGKTVLFCSVLVSNVQCKVSVLMTKHNLLPRCRALQWRQIHRAP